MQIDAPPHLPAREGGGAALTVLPMLGSIGSIALFAGGGAHSTMRYVAAGLFLLTTAAVVALQIDRQRMARGRQIGVARDDYLRHLAGVRRQARDAATQQRDTAIRRHPPPEELPSIACEGSGLWECLPGDPSFLEVRWGVGAVPSSLELVAPADDPQADPAAADALRRVLTVHRSQPDLPLSVDLREQCRIDVVGEPGPARSVVRALICSGARAHSPDHLRVAVLADRSASAGWDWIKWLPHARSPVCDDAVGPVRLACSSSEELDRLLPPDGPGVPHLLLVVDATGPPAVLRADTTTVVVGVSSCDGGYVIPAGPDRLTTPDRCDVATAEAFARRLAPLEGSGGVPGSTLSVGVPDLMTLLAGPGRGRLCVPIGIGADGPVHLDLKESAHGGMGPHGLLIGATGSGKSELLRTLVLGLTLTHRPDQLNLVLVDFKGGATFAGLADLPHVSAVITNLDDDLALVERMQAALSGELVRRQRLLRAAGNLGSVHDYEDARRAGATLEPLPALFIVVDEFSELLTAEPELIDLFVTIGRLGRGLGLHLLLASQRLDDGRLRGLESHLSYRIGLRTFSAQESRSVLGVPDAYELPAVPGLGYLRSDPTTLRRFRSAYVSKPEAVAPGAHMSSRTILPFTLGEVAPAHPNALPPSVEAKSLLDVAVRRLAGCPTRAHQVWLPPLDVADVLAGPGGLIDDLADDPQLGLTSRRWRGMGPLRVPVGVVDRPHEQRRDLLVLDLSGADGHGAVVGAPRSGKSTLLQTIVCGLAVTTTPTETQVYVLDLGGALAPLTTLPHVAGSAGRAEPEVVRRILAELTTLLDRREAYFRTHSIDSMQTYRHRRADGDPGDGHGEVVLVIDGWGTLRADFDDLEPQVAQLLACGLAFGIHVVASALRWSDFRASTRDLFGCRLELRLGDPMDSELGRRAAARVPARPGRGLTPDGSDYLSALPRTAAHAATDGEGLVDLVASIAAAWPGPSGPKLRLLPPQIGLDHVRAAAGATPGVVLGIDERDLAPVVLDVVAEPHLLAFGDRGAGLTTLLRTYCREVGQCRTANEARFLVIDPRRTLLGEVPTDRLLGRVSSGPQAERAVAELAAYLSRRLPGPDVTPAQLRARSWWEGAEVFVVVDDYDLLATGSDSPLRALQPLLAQARDVGLHLVLARRTGGASRALHDPVLQTLCDLSQPALMLSGQPEEGPLIGGLRPTPAPPGRARLVTRDRPMTVVQLAWTDPSP